MSFGRAVIGWGGCLQEGKWLHFGRQYLGRETSGKTGTSIANLNKREGGVSTGL